MRINISAIRDTKGESVEVELERPLGQMAIEGTTLKPVSLVKVYAKATCTGHRNILVQGKAKVKLEAACHRCLRRFTFDVAAEFQEQYYNASHGTSATLGHEQDEVLTYSGDVIDISREVDSHLALSLPIKLVCSSECRGLCSMCGKNLNDGECACEKEVGDIRLAPIAQLRLTQDNDEF